MWPVAQTVSKELPTTNRAQWTAHRLLRNLLLDGGAGEAEALRKVIPDDIYCERLRFRAS